MKKSLVLAMAMALGVTASAYAANPFSDVPAGHWAYDSIDKLAAAGVIEGMGDGTYQGDRNMTRYEMAQIVAKAMAKGANVDKLAAEFADELDNLGVRVAALEKKADNVKITGQIRYEYVHRAGNRGHDTTPIKNEKQLNRLRTRLFLNGKINEDWAYNARLQNDVKINNGAREDLFELNQAYLTGRIGGLKVVAGKAGNVIANGNYYDDTMEMIKVSYGKAVELSGFVGDNDWNKSDANVNGAAIATKLGKAVAVKGEVTRINPDAGDAHNIWDVAVNVNLGKNLKLDYTWLDSTKAAPSSIGNVVGLSYKGASAAKVGSWGVWARYYNQGAYTYTNHTMKFGVASDGQLGTENGFKGVGAGITYTVAKNMVAMVDYYDLESKKDEANKAHVLWSRLQMSF